MDECAEHYAGNKKFRGERTLLSIVAEKAHGRDLLGAISCFSLQHHKGGKLENRTGKSRNDPIDMNLKGEIVLPGTHTCSHRRK